MKPSELRIGNLVGYINPETNEFTNYLKIEMGWEIDEGAVYNPIPLTEEWLVKFGFQHSFDDDDSGDYEWSIKTQYKKIRLREGQDAMLTHEGKHIYLGVQVLTVHQLQNLYFALTGEELSI